MVSSLATECIQTWYSEETHLETIIPPFILIYIGDRCNIYITNIYIAYRTNLNSEPDASVRHEFFVGSNAIYQNMPCCGIWYELELETLTQEQKDIFWYQPIWVLPWF